jgi:hypothetical protein
MGEEELVALVRESLNAATRVGATKPSDFSKCHAAPAVWRAFLRVDSYSRAKLVRIVRRVSL